MNNEINIEEIILSKVYDILKISSNERTSIYNMTVSELNLDSLEFFEFIIDLEENHKIYFPLYNISNKLTLLELIKSAKLK